MKVKTKLKLNIFFALGLVAIAGLIIFIAIQEVKKTSENQTLALEMRKTVFELRNFGSEFLIYGDDRAVVQWQTKYDLLLKLLAADKSEQKESLLVLDKIDRATRNLRTIFLDELVPRRLGITKEEHAISGELEQRLITQFFISTDDLVSNSSHLADISILATKDTEQKTASSILIIILIIGAGSLVANGTIYRSISKPISKLQEGTKAFAEGNFDYRLSNLGKDEFGLLANGFNTMAESLKELYANLENKVKERTTQLEEAKVKDDAMLSSIGDGLVITDTDGKILIVNQAFEHLTGWNVGEVQGKVFTDVLPMIDENGKVVPEHERLISKTLREKTTTTTTTTTVQYKRKDGLAFPVALTVSPVIFNGNLIGAVEVFRDITKEKDIDRAKSEFVSLASHQLKTPATIVKLYTERMLGDKIDMLTPKQKDYITEVSVAGQRMIDIVNALLNVSRIELGAFSVRPIPKDVITTLKDVLHELEPRIKEKNLAVEATYHKTSCVLPVDDPLFRMVLNNIISNAIQYTPEKKSIRVTSEEVKKDHTIDTHKILEDSLIITVSDDGCGVPKNQQEKIFTKFFRADNARIMHTDGTGLGLYVVKSILDHTGGTIWFRSEEKEGTTFYITIPLSGMRQKEGTKSLSNSQNFS